MPRDVLQMIDSWSLYRDGQLVAEAHKGRNLKDTDVQPGEVYAYTIVLNAPDWVSSDEDRAWVDAPCVGDCDEGPASSEQDLVDDDKATDLIDDDPAMDDEQITADGISFTLPVSIPATGKMKAAIGNVSLAPQTAQLTETAGTSQPQEGDRPIDGVVQNEDPAGSEPPEVELSSQNADSDVLSSFNDYRDDASVWHRTFIIDQYIKGPEPFVTWNYFGGDNRGFSNSLNASFRTEVKTITDFETDRVIAYRPSVSNTKRYTRRSNGTYVLNAEKTATLDPIVQSVNENGRVRVRVRHSSSNPFQSYYPAIDYHWEYIMVSDGGVTARGLHDGAPSYETFYEPPFSATPTRVYTYRQGSFVRLGGFMDAKGRTWCKPKGAGFNCPGFGNPRWV